MKERAALAASEADVTRLTADLLLRLFFITLEPSVG